MRQAGKIIRREWREDANGFLVSIEFTVQRGQRALPDDEGRVLPNQALHRLFQFLKPTLERAQLIQLNTKKNERRLRLDPFPTLQHFVHHPFPFDESSLQ